MTCQRERCGRDAFWAPAIILVSRDGREFPTYLNLQLCLEHRNELKITDLVSPQTVTDFWGKIYPVLTREPADEGIFGRMRLDFTALDSEPMKAMAKVRAEKVEGS